MSSPSTAVKLIPQTKKSKKKRPNFRPKSNLKKSVKSTGTGTTASSSTTTASSSNAVTSKLQSKTATATENAADTVDNEQEQDDNASPLPGKSVRKRVKRITIGGSTTLGEQSEQLEGEQTDDEQRTQQQEPAETSTALVTTAQPQQLNAETDPDTVALATAATEAQERAKEAAAITALQDKKLLDQLVAEDPKGVRLNSFCKTIKKKRKKKDPADVNKNKNKKKHKNAGNANANNAAANITQGDQSTTKGAPVVQIIDGEIVIQESSLVVQSRKTVEEVENEFDQVVEEDATMAIIGASYSSFKNTNEFEKAKRGSHHWTIAETKLFYLGLRQLGTDFCCMEAMFEKRSRKQLKRKYQMELAKNTKLVDWALHPDNRTEIDLALFNVELTDEDIQKSIENQNKPVTVEATTSNSKKNKAVRVKIDGGDGATDDGVWEEVHEDAEEENHNKRASAASFWANKNNDDDAGNNDQSEGNIATGTTEVEPTTSTSANKEDPFSGEFGEDDLMEPSMDEFFHHEVSMMGDDEPTHDPGVATVDAAAATTTTTNSATPTTTRILTRTLTPTTTPAKEATESTAEPSTKETASISLVPTSSNKKTKRPKKFRTMVRKKK